MSSKNLIKRPLDQWKERYLEIVFRSEEAKPEYSYHGFWPDERLRGKLTESYRCLFELSPSETNLRVRIDKLIGGFKFHVRVDFEGEVLSATGRGSNPKKALQQSLDQMHLKLRRWRTERFEEDEASHRMHDPRGAFVELTHLLPKEQRPSVLIVDDNPISVKLMESCLRQLGCETMSVSSGAEAIDQITVSDFDLMILDWQMPVLSGAQTIIQAQERISFDSGLRLPWVSSQLPVLTYSGEMIQKQQFPDCENFAFKGHVPKATDYASLRARTVELLAEIAVA